MMSNYKEIEVKAFGKDGKQFEFTVNRDVISHYRQWISSPEQGVGKILTLLTLKGNPKGIILDCGYDTFKKKLAIPSVQLDGLTEDQISKVSDLVKSFQKINRK
jgi:hypothetical protein